MLVFLRAVAFRWTSESLLNPSSSSFRILKTNSICLSSRPFSYKSEITILIKNDCKSLSKRWLFFEIPHPTKKSDPVVKIIRKSMYRQLGDFSPRRGPVWGSTSWGMCQLGDFNLSDFLGKIFILIHLYLINATNEHYFSN